jgi:DNA-binding YbaB/EbfC family protein
MPGIDINYFVRQANKLTEKLEKRKTELAEETVEGRAGDGLVVVVATATQDIKSVKIDPKALTSNDVALLEDLVTAAVHDLEAEVLHQTLQGLAAQGPNGGGRHAVMPGTAS